MKVFLSSTFLDLLDERNAILDALQKRSTSAVAMEACPTTPLATALDNLRRCDVMILVIGFKAGTLVPDDSGRTYTSAEYEESVKSGKNVLLFVKGHPWRNDEESPEKRAALDSFKARACANSTPCHFLTPDRLALDVVLSLDQWEARGRPGARRTFTSPREYFAYKDPPGEVHILDFSTALFGREPYIRELDEFADASAKRVCVLSGRGGIGKTKILHDWANSRADSVVLLRDEPFWHEDSEKEIPIGCRTVIVDDAHREETFGRVLQIVLETTSRRNLKLIASTRPGSTTRVTQEIFRKFDSTKVVQLPELQELDKRQSRALAEHVLGNDFRHFAPHLAEIASNSPLVIVAGGRLIGMRKIDPSALTTLDEFRSAVFGRLLDEMDLRGPRFVIDPPHPVLHLIAALGPVDVERRDFQQSASTLLGNAVDEILATLDALALTGIVTARPNLVRVLSDVLSDYLLENRCISSEGMTTHYADRVYEYCGANSLKNLMRNLAELDWRRGRSRETGLSLLDAIWADINSRFFSGDEYVRHQILTDLVDAAIYQPNHVVALIRGAIEHPVTLEGTEPHAGYRMGQDYVLSALPGLLEATAYHPEFLRESVTVLWELTRSDEARSAAARNAKAVLKRLSSWHRFGHPAHNFAMLVEAIRLVKRADAFATDYTPFDLIEQILEREGEFNEWEDEKTVSFGGFGLNYAAVGPVRESALDYLEFALEHDGNPAIQSVSIMKGLLHSYLNRVGRESTEEERGW